MKRKSLIFSLVLVLIVTALTGCGKDSKESSKKDVSNGLSKGDEFVVGFDAEYPPYGYKDGDDYVGFDLDLAQEVCDRLGWTLKKQPIDWDSKDMELNSGSIDCIWNGFTVTGREDNYTWSIPYVDNSIVVVVNANSDIKSLDDLAGKIVCTQADSSALAALTDEEDNEENLKLAATFADLQQVPDYNTAFLNLESGAVDAIAVDIGVAKYQINGKEDKFAQLTDPISKEQYAVGFKLGNTKLCKQVEDVLKEMYNDGTIEKIAKNYQDYSVPEMLCIGDYID